ncbi:MAG: hypothetical protein WDN46_07190 [Methylocella sp.]
MAHIKLMLGSLEINDDEAASHHASHAVEGMRATALLINEIMDLHHVTAQPGGGGR